MFPTSLQSIIANSFVVIKYYPELVVVAGQHTDAERISRMGYSSSHDVGNFALEIQLGGGESPVTRVSDVSGSQVGNVFHIL